MWGDFNDGIFSFLSDYQMVLDCQIFVLVKEKDAGAAIAATRECLFPAYHNLTLPLNNLNFLFEKCTTSFNQTTELTSDK
jgi:hypothetical protein